MSKINIQLVKSAIIKKLKKIKNPNNEIVGFISKKGEIYTVGSDSKIIGRLFEVLTEPLLQNVAKELNMTLHSSPKQTIYPDFWLSNDNSVDSNRIAIDIKTTYRKGKNTKLGFTLGSYTSFLRNNTKNIAGNYDMYDYHLIIGYIYDRNKKYNTKVFSYSNINNIDPPVLNIEFFVAEKYKIAGEKPGSGNTANIGTISSSNINDFINEKGPFSLLGNSIFEDYWRNYPTPKEKANNNIKYSDIEGYINWKKQNDKSKAKELEQSYKKYKKELK